jgi:hypothetical protein
MVKDANRYKECNRTQGISTTDLVGRMVRHTLTLTTLNSNLSGLVRIIGWIPMFVFVVENIFFLNKNWENLVGATKGFLAVSNPTLSQFKVRLWRKYTCKELGTQFIESCNLIWFSLFYSISLGIQILRTKLE